MKRIVVGLALAFVTLLLFGGCGSERTQESFEPSESLPDIQGAFEAFEIENEYDKIDEPFILPEHIMHAGGGMKDGRLQTNSVDALNVSYGDGNYWVELDFNQTTDGYWVCVHDWSSFYSSVITGLKIPDIEMFELYRKSTYGYETPTLEVLIEWMKEHPKAIVVTDVKDNNLGFARDIAENYPDLKDRFVIQIYHTEEYAAVTECGFEKIIYTLYAELPEKRYHIESLSEFVERSDKLIALTYAGFKENSEDIAAVCKEIELPIYVHTINSLEEKSFWRELGVYGFYCDYISDAVG